MFKRIANQLASPNIEQRAAILAGKNISYTLKRTSRRRSIGLRIDDRGLTVSVPLRASEKWLHSVLQDKADWVVEKLAGWQVSQSLVTSWSDGDVIAYLGELLTLRVAQDLFPAAAQQCNHELWLYLTHDYTQAQVDRAVTAWYQQTALQLFKQRVEYFQTRLGVAPHAVNLSHAKTQWGSCTAQGSVRLNVYLIRLPVRLIDYVVVHELAHLRELNHSAAFWQVVERACPDYLKLRAELKAIRLG